MKFLITKQFLIEAKSEKEAVQKFEATKNPNKFFKKLAIEEIIEKPSLEEIIKHYKTGVGDNCIVCKNTLQAPFTNLKGQVKCVHCGMTYQIQGGQNLSTEFMSKNNLSVGEIAQRYCDMYEFLPIAEEYWNTFHKRMPFGADDNITLDERSSFERWLVENSKRFKKAYEKSFNWNRLEVQYA